MNNSKHILNTPVTKFMVFSSYFTTKINIHSTNL